MANNSVENWQPAEGSDASLKSGPSNNPGWATAAREGQSATKLEPGTNSLPAAFPHSDNVFQVAGSAAAGPGSQPLETTADAWLSRLEAGRMPGGVDNFAPPSDRYNSVLNGLMSYEHNGDDPWSSTGSDQQSHHHHHGDRRANGGGSPGWGGGGGSGGSGGDAPAWPTGTGNGTGSGGDVPAWPTGSGNGTGSGGDVPGWPTGTGNGTGSGGDVPGGTPGTGTGNGTGGGSDLSSILQAGPGVTSQEMQQAIADLNSLPAPIQQALLASGAQIQLASGWQPGLPQGQNNGTSGLVYADSGMMNQALIHEASEMAGQTANNVAGLWDDPKAVQLADQALNALGPNAAAQIGDLNDTIGNAQGDGDLISNVIAALVTADNRTVGSDSVGQSVMQQSVAAAPQLTAYIAQALGMPDPFANNEQVG